MASIRENARPGGETTWSVLYRHGKRQTSMTFGVLNGDPKRGVIGAADFKALIDTLGSVDKALKALDAGRDNRLTVDQLAEQFFTWKARSVEPRTLNDYRRDYRNWIEPWFGHRAAELIDEGDVQKWVDHMAESGLAAKTILDRHTILHSMYKFGRARSRRLVTHNPCEETDFPKAKKKPPKGTTIAEFAAIIEAGRKRNPDAADLICFLGETGWRWSEGAALAVADVEDDGRDVWATVGAVFRIDGNWKQVRLEDEAKSYRAFRRIRLFPESAAVVRRRMVGKGPDDLVFTNSRGRQWSQNTFLRETWPRILTDAKLWRGPRVSPTPHWLRHMHVAVLGAAGVPIQEIQRRIGHENISTTIGVYGGMIGDISDASLDRGADIMAGRQNAPGVAPAQVVAGELA